MPFLQMQDKTALYYYDWGTGKPIVLIHAWPLSSASWESNARALVEAGYRVIAYDRRGFGRSDWAGSGYDYDTLAGDLNELIETLHLSDVALIGFSMGSGEAVRYLATYGEARISKVALVSASTPFLLKTSDNPEGIDRTVFDGLIASLEADRADTMRNQGKVFYGVSATNHPVSDALLDYTQMIAMQGSPLATIRLVRTWSETDFRDDLRKITVPTLVIHGTDDHSVPIDISGRRTAALVAHAEFLEYEGQPHGLIVTAAARFHKDLLDFLRK